MKKKILNFLLVIFMFFTMVGVVHNTTSENPIPVNAVATEVNLVTENPTGKTLYLMDPNGVLHTDTPKEPGSLVATVRIRFGGSVDIPLTDNGSNVYTGSFSTVRPPLGGLLGMWLKITYTDPQGRVQSTDEVDIATSIMEAIKNDYNNQDALISIDRDSNGKLYLSSDTDVFNGLNYLFYAYQGEVGDVIYCEYSNGTRGDKNMYNIPMVLTNYRYNDLPVYRACIYSYPNNYYINNLIFKVIKHTGVEDLTKRVTPITKNTGYSTWHAKVYFQTEPVQEHSKNWHQFYQVGNPYTATFYWGSTENNAYGDVYATRESGKDNNYIIEIPNNPTARGYTFTGWLNTSTNQIQDFSGGDKVFLGESANFIAQWKEGDCVFIYLNPKFIDNIHGTYEPANLRLHLSRLDNLSVSKEFEMDFMPRSSIYRIVIALNGSKMDISSIKSCKISYTIGSTYYESNVMTTPQIDTNNLSHRSFHIVVPNKLNDHNHVASGFSFEKLYSVTYHYGDSWELIYKHLPISIGVLHPLFLEKESSTLEGWYTSLNYKKDAVNLNTRFEPKVLTSNTDLYANYILNNDYYFYVDNYQNEEWKPTSITFYNDYFFNYQETYQIPAQDIAKDLGHDIYQIRFDISKSFSDFYVSGTSTSAAIATSVPRTESKSMLTEYTYFDITPDKKTVDNKRVNIINTELYENCLVGAQKLPYDEEKQENAFRFTIGVPSEIDDYYQNTFDPTLPETGQTNLGLKIIFVEEDSCYIGFWNFKEIFKTEAIRLDDLYVKDTPYDGITYNGFYTLTVRDDVAFKYNSFSHIIIVGVYRNTDNKLKVIKATEYQIVSRTNGKVDIYYQPNHVIKNEK